MNADSEGRLKIVVVYPPGERPLPVSIPARARVLPDVD